jgi:hypothetical protein
MVHQGVLEEGLYENRNLLEESKELTASTATGPISKQKKRNKKARKAKARQAAIADSDFDSYFDAMIEENKNIKYFDPKWSNLVKAVEKGEETYACQKCLPNETFACESKLRDHMIKSHGAKLLFHDASRQI